MSEPKARGAPREAGSSSCELEDQFAFYGQYHTNKVNVLIHIVCVPTIFFTSLILAHKLPYFPSLPSLAISIPAALQPYLGAAWVPNLSTLTALGYALYFITLEPIAGLIYAPLLLALGQWSNTLAHEGVIEVGGQQRSVMQLATIGFVGSWIAQFIGHGKFEGRAPALFDSLLQSLVLAVFFVWMEVLFMFGYRPALHRRLQNRIGKAVLKYRQERPRK